MASYTRQMIDAAKPWLDANPDQNDAILRFPRSPESRLRIEKAKMAVAQLGPQDRRSLIAEMNQIVAEHQAATAELRANENRLEELLNENVRDHHHKHDADHGLRIDLSRWLVTWGRTGYNVFDLSQDFVAAMLLTDARDVDIAEVQLPFPALLMLIPDGFARGTEGASYTKIHISEASPSDIAQIAVTQEVSDLVRSLPKASLTRVLDRVDGRLSTAASHALLGTPPTHTTIHIAATDGVHMLDTFIERDALTWDAFDDIPDNVTDEADKQARHTIRRIAFGTLAYLSAVRAAAEPRQIQPRKRREQRDEAKVWDVGRTIRIDPQLMRSVRAGSREVAFRIKHRHIVRGHYRNQPIGSGRQERKRIWIAPFWRGPDDGAMLTHVYKPMLP